MVIVCLLFLSVIVELALLLWHLDTVHNIYIKYYFKSLS